VVWVDRMIIEPRLPPEIVARPWLRVLPDGGVMVTVCVLSKPLVTTFEIDTLPPPLDR